MSNIKHRRLQELDRSDFEIIQGEPDIRGWDVRNAAGNKIGEVEELIIDAAVKKVRYMVVDLHKNELSLEARKVLIPIGLAALHEKDDDVILNGIDPQHLSALPVYDKDHLDEETEKSICSTLGRASSTGTAAAKESGAVEESHEFYRHAYFDDDNLYKHRLHEAQPAHENKGESEYEKGLRLWERRSEGGIIAAAAGSNSDNHQAGNRAEKDIPEQARIDMVRNRRKGYEERRSTGGSSHYNDQPHRKDTIEKRIRDEGLRDA